jgi:transcriptional regulator with XRE-family HTH domain
VDNGAVGRTTGERIKHYRVRAGMSRPVLGGLVGRSAEWVKALETGRLLTPRLSLLLQLARALDVDDLAKLTGNDLDVPVEVFTGPTHSALEAVRAALTEYRLDPLAPRVDSRHLALRLDNAWTVRHSSPDHRTAVGSVLPGLIRAAQRTVRATSGPERRTARRTLAGVYQLADFYVAYQPAPELVWLVADRAITEAQEADDPYAIAGGAWALTQALRDAGRWDEALATAASGARALEHEQASDDWRGLWGALNFETAYVHARRGKYGLAWSHWERANDVARQLGSRYRHTQTSFSQAVMQAHAVTLDVELRRAGDAAKRGARFDPATIPSLPRRSRHLVEVARAHHQQGDKAATCGYLLAALNTAPETVQYNGFARDMTRTLLARPPTGLTVEVRELAAGVGVRT